MNKLLLINSNTATAPYPVPPLGLSLLAQVLKADYQVKMLDGFELAPEKIGGLIRQYQPDYIGIGIRNIDDMVKEEPCSYIDLILADIIKPVRAAFSGPLILGGSGFTIFPAEIMRLSGADYGIAGEGEALLPELLRCLDEGRPLPTAPGLYVGSRSNGSGQAAAFDLDKLGPADIDTFISYTPYLRRSAYPIQTKRGCAHRCLYCSYPQLEGRVFRKRSPVRVVDEIEATSRRFPGPLTFEFVDSTFNDPPGHGEAVCREIIRRGLTVSLRTMGINPANVTSELLQLMKGAGFGQIDSTPDSACDIMLKNLCKNFSRAQLVRTAALIREHGLPTMWFFIFGGPGENDQTLAETFAFIDQYVHPEDMVHMTEGLRIYPHTRLHRIAVEENLVSPDESLLKPRYYVSSQLGEERLTALLKEAAAVRPNCIRSAESSPSPDMLQEAFAIRASMGLTEPMFRTLLRLRRQRFQRGEGDMP